jgi:hypothetical protein
MFPNKKQITKVTIFTRDYQGNEEEVSITQNSCELDVLKYAEVFKGLLLAHGFAEENVLAMFGEL